MEEWMKIAILYALGTLVLLVDLFVPSSGVLMVVGLGLFGFGLYEAFQISLTAGIVNAVMLMIAIPAGFVIAIRNWHRTPIGRRISPPNPTLTAQDRLPVSELSALLGSTGRSVTLLRPVGMCEFKGKRYECMAETGVIVSGIEVEAVRLSDRTVVVRPAAVQSTPRA